MGALIVLDGTFDGDGEGVEGHIDQSEAELTEAEPAGQIFLGGFDLLDVLAGDGVAGDVVTGEGVEELRLVAPVFHHLRGQLDEVALHAGAADAGVGAVGEHAAWRGRTRA